MDAPVFDFLQRIAQVRGARPFEPAAPGLWRVGSLDGLVLPTVAIVGTRAATPYGRRLARAFAEALGRAGCCIVSGLALGIDTAAHEGALAAGAPTIGVLGGGHRHFFPRRNLGLARRLVAAGGAVLSPFEPGQPARPGQFLARNGIVAALSDAVLVVEAPERSGALNTAGSAAGRIPVLAVPGDVDRPHVRGCLALIRDGATLARHAGDVLEALGQPAAAAAAAGGARVPDDPLAARLCASLDAGEEEFDDLVAAGGAGTAATLGALTRLELDGTVERCGATRWVRVPSAMLGRRC